jgi:hypothetical protein
LQVTDYYSNLSILFLQKEKAHKKVCVRKSTGQICLHFRPGMGENKGVAGALPGEQQSPGLLHLDLQICQSCFSKKKKHTKRCAFLFGGTGQI